MVNRVLSVFDRILLIEAATICGKGEEFEV
jgi:hypothetical protein